MAINSTYYLDAADLTLATAVYLDLELTLISPDGFYGNGIITRQQSLGMLLAAEACATCTTPCGIDIQENGSTGIYLVNLETGTDIGAVIVRFYADVTPNGIRATFDGNVYNKLTSPYDGLHQSSNPNNFTFVGDIAGDCGISGSSYPVLEEFLYVAGAFTATGLAQSLTIAPGDVSLSNQDPLDCMMVIPKSSATPSIINFEVFGPCIQAKFEVSVACPVLLTGFGSSSVLGSSALACAAGLTETYYNASLNDTPGIVDVYDFVYSDEIGAVPLANGFYNASGSIAGGEIWFQVTSGVVVAIGNCGTLITLCKGTTTVDVCCDCV